MHSLARWGRLVTGLLCLPWLAAAQAQYPPSYFSFPIKPGQPNSLSGNMGELRTNHFHAGLDIRTEARIGLPVTVAAEGHVYRVRVSSYGYGNVVYVRHPNGMGTVYAHLDRFGPAIANYVRRAQYQQQSFVVDLFPESGELPLRRGQQVGWSGNSGSSGGPHLHFEIRAPDEKVLDPLRFGFSEIADDVAPFLTLVGLRPLEANARVAGVFDLQLIRPTARGRHYGLPAPVEAFGLVGLEIEAFDRQTRSGFRNGVAYVAVHVGDSLAYEMHLETFAFDESNQINVHKDYGAFVQEGAKRQRCYLTDGNVLPFYRTNADRGALRIAPGRDYPVRITLRDVMGNTTYCNFIIRGVGPARVLAVDPDPAANQVRFAYSLQENLLRIEAENLPGTSRPAVMYSQRQKLVLPPAYARGRSTFYLWDMRRGLPDSLRADGHTAYFSFRGVAFPGQPNVIRHGRVTVEVPSEALYDTLYLEIDDEPEALRLHNYAVPLREPITVRWQANLSGLDLEPRTQAYLSSGTRRSHVGGQWAGDTLVFTTKKLGTFLLAEDRDLPLVRPVRVNSREAVFTVADAQSGIADFRATLNGQWLLMNYDHKRNLLWAETADGGPLQGQFRLEVTDQAGNRQIFERSI